MSEEFDHFKPMELARATKHLADRLRYFDDQYTRFVFEWSDEDIEAVLGLMQAIKMENEWVPPALPEEWDWEITTHFPREKATGDK